MNTFLLSFLTIASLHLLAVISPGPDFALVTRNALLYPRRESIYTALGISLGITVHVSYCIFGVVWIAEHSVVFFRILKYLGAAYLIYMGIKSLTTSMPLSTHNRDLSKNSSITTGQALRQGFFCNALNPKAGLFFIGLFTLVIKPHTPIWQQMVYGAWMVLVTFIWFSCVAYFITRQDMHNKLQRIQPMIVKILGALLLIMGISLLFLTF